MTLVDGTCLGLPIAVHATKERKILGWTYCLAAASGLPGRDATFVRASTEAGVRVAGINFYRDEKASILRHPTNR